MPIGSHGATYCLSAITARAPNAAIGSIGVKTSTLDQRCLPYAGLSSPERFWFQRRSVAAFGGIRFERTPTSRLNDSAETQTPTTSGWVGEFLGNSEMCSDTTVVSTGNSEMCIDTTVVSIGNSEMCIVARRLLDPMWMVVGARMPGEQGSDGR